jgi:uncharacterized protein (DUF58 family)
MLETGLIEYRLRWLSGTVFPDAHLGHMTGAGLLFKQHQPLAANCDPRRIDLRASVLDPFEHFRVRAYHQPSRIDVYLLADLSASMGHAGKQMILATLLRTLARSAFGYGDRFGFIGAGEAIEQRWLLPAGMHFEPVSRVAGQLENAHFSGTAAGLRQVSAYLPAERSLLFLLTDGHFSLAYLSDLLASLQMQDVVPLVLWDPDEYRRLPAWGLLPVRDMESGASRTLVMRPAFRNRIVAAYEQRRQALLGTFRAFGNEPLFIERCDIPAINRHLHQRAA